MEQVFGDITEEFDFDEASLDFYDEPLSGLFRRKSDGQWFAFDCQHLVDHLLWHWTLVPADEGAHVREVLERAAESTEGFWLSIVEDRRSTPESICRLVRIENARAKPVVFSVKARPAGL